ncbi:hypothetical protein CH063_05407, partial [Colletotrichum higginsianum]
QHPKSLRHETLRPLLLCSRKTPSESKLCFPRPRRVSSQRQTASLYRTNMINHEDGAFEALLAVRKDIYGQPVQYDA